MASANVVFRALAHPARRRILAMLAQSNRSVKQLTRAFDMSQPAVSQHLRELKRARLARSEKVGMEQIYRLTADPLRLVFEWSSQYKRFFDPSGHAWSFVSLPENPQVHSRRRQRKHGR